MNAARNSVRCVAVVGDYMLDAYVRGSVSRVCPDAPAPVLDAEPERFAPGGAANVAIGSTARGFEAIACGFTGHDAAAQMLETLLAEAGVRLDALVNVPGRHTLVKRRFCCGDQVLLRADTGSTGPVPDSVVPKLDTVLAGVDAVLVSDYGYGAMTPGVLDAIARRRAGDDAPPLLVDAKDLSRYRALAPDLIKPNYAQAVKTLGEQPRDDRVAHAGELLGPLRALTGARNAVITLDAAGCVAADADGHAVHLPAPAVEIRSTAGAGDTFLVALAEGLLAGQPPLEAARFATHAATLACRSRGTATPSLQADPPVPDRNKRVAPGEIDRWCDRVRAQGRTIVLTNGCFDIFHAGHAEFLARAAEQGDALLVAVNTDESVTRLKGEGRPVNGLNDRLRVLESIGVVDAVTWFDGDTAATVAATVTPDVYVKGSDYRGLTFPEAELVSAHGGCVVFVDLLEGRSTTDIVRRVRQPNREVAV